MKSQKHCSEQGFCRRRRPFPSLTTSENAMNRDALKLFQNSNGEVEPHHMVMILTKPLFQGCTYYTTYGQTRPRTYISS
jgi:hypothetical protein